MTARYHKINDIYAPALGLSAVTLASERTSNVFSVKGYRNLTVYLNLTARSASTALICKLFTSNNATTLGQTKSESISSGTGTLSSYSQSFANTATGIVTFRFDLDDDFALIKVSGTSGAAGDVCTVDLRMSTGQ